MSKQDAAASQKESRYRFVIAALTVWAYFAVGVSWQNVSPVLPLITEDYKINYGTAGLLVGVVMFVHGVFGIPSGIIVARLGIRRVFTVCWILMGLLTLTVLSPNFEGLLALRVVYGFGTALLFPATAPLLMQWFKAKEIPVLTSVNVACMSLGIAVSLGTAVPLSGLIGWPKMLGLFGTVGLLGALAWLLLGKAEDGSNGPVSRLAIVDVKAVLRNRTLLALVVADSTVLGQYIVLSGWLPTFYNETRGMSLVEGGVITGILPAVGAVSVLLGGLLTLKVRSKRLFFIVPGLMAGLGGLGSFLIDDPVVTYASIVMLGLGSWLYLPILLTLPMELP